MLSQDRIEQVRCVLGLLYTAAVALKLEKCKLFTETVVYFRHFIHYCRRGLAQHSTVSDARLDHPTVQRENPSLLTFWNDVRRCLPNFTIFAATLNKKLRKDQPKHLSNLDERESAAVATCRNGLISLPLQAPQTSKGRYTLQNSAWRKEIGCVTLSNEKDASGWPVDFCFRARNDKQQKLATP